MKEERENIGKKGVFKLRENLSTTPTYQEAEGLLKKLEKRLDQEISNLLKD